MEWRRDHKSACGRFWCSQGTRSGSWTLYDNSIRDANGASKSTSHRTLREAKDYADYVAGDAPGKPLIEIL